MCICAGANEQEKDEKERLEIEERGLERGLVKCYCCGQFINS